MAKIIATPFSYKELQECISNNAKEAHLSTKLSKRKSHQIVSLINNYLLYQYKTRQFSNLFSDPTKVFLSGLIIPTHNMVYVYSAKNPTDQYSPCSYYLFMIREFSEIGLHPITICQKAYIERLETYHTRLPRIKGVMNVK